MPGPVLVPKLLTMDELAERRVPFLRVGRFIRFDPAQIVTWLDSSRVPGVSV